TRVALTITLNGKGTKFHLPLKRTMKIMKKQKDLKQQHQCSFRPPVQAGDRGSVKKWRKTYYG
ncbi:hypothetical protein, partial [Victivallis vadensis]|uniref:hypothetical protein n=1 Tax=Victivallis vadensis TaxID=172901 RepID=UPI003AF79770